MMTSALLLASLSAAPIDVVVAQGAAASALRAELAGRTLVDGAALHGYLFGDGGSVIGIGQDFQAFGAAPVSAWPRELASKWTSALAHCRDLAGPPPWKETLPAARACGLRLSNYLWQVYLEHVGAERVFELWGAVDKKEKRAQVEGVRYAAGAAESRVLQARVAPEALGAELASVARRLVAGEGAARPRELVRELAQAPALGDPFSGEAVDRSPVKLKRTCAAMPKALTITPASVVAQAVAARWSATGGGAADSASCTLAFTEHEENEPLLGGTVRVVAAILKCGAASASTELARSPLAKISPVTVLSERLVRGLAERFCASSP